MPIERARRVWRCSLSPDLTHTLRTVVAAGFLPLSAAGAMAATDTTVRRLLYTAKRVF